MEPEGDAVGDGPQPWHESVGIAKRAEVLQQHDEYVLYGIVDVMRRNPANPELSGHGADLLAIHSLEDASVAVSWSAYGATQGALPQRRRGLWA